MSDDQPERLPARTSAETALEVAATVSSAVPWLGGPISNVLSGMSLGRKMKRVKELLDGLADDLKEFKSEVSEKYVATDEFEELLEKTLRKTADERNEEKRRLYRAFLRQAIKSPGEPGYEERIRFLRTLEELHPDHIRVIYALLQAPEGHSSVMGSPVETLVKRISGMTRDGIEDLVNQLNAMQITKLSSLRTVMTGHGAADLRNSFTPYGRRFMAFIEK